MLLFLQVKKTTLEWSIWVCYVEATFGGGVPSI